MINLHVPMQTNSQSNPQKNYPNTIEADTKNHSIIANGPVSKYIKMLGEDESLNTVHENNRCREEDLEIITLEAAFEYSANAVIISNKEGIVKYVNPKFTETTGYCPHETIGKNLRLLLAGKDAEQKYNAIGDTMMSGDIWRGELNTRKKNGEYFWERVTITPIKSRQNVITAFLVVKEDFTTQKEMERKLKVQAQQLIETKLKAGESDRLKSVFLSNINHEIRTPMNGILGFSNLLKIPELSGEEIEDYTDAIITSGERLLNVVNNLIDISRIESEQVSVVNEEIEICQQMRTVYNYFKPEAEQKGLRLIYEKNIASDKLIINTDFDKIFSVLTNLIHNAIKFGDKGNVTFGFSKMNNCLEFYVKDNGIGISEKNKRVIFNRFRQSSETFTREYEGTGLGLAISQAYVKMLDGKIWVESEEGVGSTFFFTIPYTASDEINKMDIAYLNQ